MLTSMRKGASGWIAKILFALLILSFGAWGITDYLTPDPDPIVITVGDTEVRQSAFRSQFTRALDRLRGQIGSTVTQEFAVQMGLDKEVISSVIDQQVMTRESERMGMMVSDDVLRAAIAANPAFQGLAGGFDRQQYERVLYQSGLGEGQYLADLQGRLVRDPLIGAATAAPPPPDALVNAQYAFAAEKRQVTLMYRAHNTLPAPADPGDTVLREAYDKEDYFYQQGELRDLSAILLDPEQIAKGFAIADDRIQAEYEDRQGQYFTPERRDIAQMLFQDADAAATAAGRLNAGEAWVAVADGSGAAVTELGTILKTELLTPELGEAAFALSAPGAAEPVQSPFGQHVLFVKAIQPPETRPLAEVRDEIQQSLALDLAVTEMIERANAVEDAMAAGDSLESAADAAEVQVVKMLGIGRNGQNAAGERPEGVPQDGQFLNVSFQTVDGESSILTDRADGGYFVVRVDRIEPEAKKPFAAVRVDVLKEWASTQQGTQAQQVADALVEQLRSGTADTEAAQAASFTLAKPPAFSRRDQPPPTTIDLVNTVFDSKPGEYFVHNDLGQVFVAKIDEVITAKGADDPALVSVRQALDRDRRVEIGQVFQKAIRAQYDVTIDQAAIDYILR